MHPDFVTTLYRAQEHQLEDRLERRRARLERQGASPARRRLQLHVHRATAHRR